MLLSQRHSPSKQTIAKMDFVKHAQCVCPVFALIPNKLKLAVHSSRKEDKEYA
jgi:hypothetical protein